MNWFFIALGAPILWAAVNHADKYLLSKYSKGKNDAVGALFIFSTLIALIVLPLIYFINPEIVFIGERNALILILTGIISAFGILLYLYALQKEEASVVMPIFQTIPIFAYILAYFFLKEVLTTNQFIGIGFIIVGAIFITLEFKEKIKIKSGVLFLTLVSSFLFALYETIFKVIAMEEGFLASLFWEYVGILLVGLVFFSCVRKYREEFFKMVKINSKFIISFNTVSELVTVLGNSLVNFALLLAPVALVLSVTNLQPLFVFIFGILLTLFFPRFGREKNTPLDLMQKGVATILVVIGSVLLV